MKATAGPIYHCGEPLAAGPIIYIHTYNYIYVTGFAKRDHLGLRSDFELGLPAFTGNMTCSRVYARGDTLYTAPNGPFSQIRTHILAIFIEHPHKGRST